MQEDKIEGLKIGGDDYLTKPFDIDELCLKIEVFLKRKEINSAQNNLLQNWRFSIKCYRANTKYIRNRKNTHIKRN